MKKRNEKREKTASSDGRGRQPTVAGRYRSTFAKALVGSALLWAALPPLEWSPLAFLAPVLWVLLLRQKELTGRRPYLCLWLAGCLFWLAALHWLRLPHWLTIFGWIAMGIYMGLYLPVFIALGRVAVHRLRVPVIVAAPVVWMGLELAQGHMLTGFTMGNLGSTQHGWIELIQISDLAGVYGVGFVVMWVASCLARTVPVEGQSFTWRPLLPAAAMVVVVLLYGHLRVREPSGRVDARIALIQGSIDTVLNPEAGSRERMHAQYHELTQTAVRRFGCSRIDLIVWPETVFFGPLVTPVPGAPDDVSQEPASETERTYWQNLRECDRVVRRLMAIMATQFDAPMLVGIDRKQLVPQGIENYNSAAFVDRTGQLVGYYDKMHRVVFGEYIPFADSLSWLVDLTPLNSLNLTLDPGSGPVAFELDGRWIAPNICYESVLPHLIRRQINTLARHGREPDILVNLTNDGWFWGSSELDMHLACAVFRAVECRKPFLIAANTGFSAWIDADGRMRAKGPRRATGALLAEVNVGERTSWYRRYGDIPAGVCLMACAVFAVVGCRDRWQKRRTAKPQSPVAMGGRKA